jgi:hypothetical protein
LRLLFLSIFSVFLFFGCGGGGSETAFANTQSDVPEYFVKYSDSMDEVTGQVSFYLDNIPINHRVELSNFIPVIDGCSIDLLSSSISPDILNFSAINSDATLTLNIKFLSACSNQKLTLKAKYKDTSILGHKLITKTKDISYEFIIKRDTSSQTNKYTTILKQSTLNITKNSQTSNVIVAVYDGLSSPVDDGEVDIIYPDIVKNGVNIGSFTPSSAQIKDGEAIFIYTAPNDLASLVNSGINNTAFKFYYNGDTLNSTTLNVNFASDTNQSVNKTYKTVFQPQNGEYKMSLEESKTFSIAIADDENLNVADTNIYDLNVSLENSSIAYLVNSNGSEGTKFTFKNQNNVTLTLKTRTISGLVPIHVSSKFKDANGNDMFLNETFNIVVESGPPTAISISYAGTSQDTDRAKFIEKFAISVTDKYFNPVNTNPQVSVGAIVGYANYDDKNIHIIEYLSLIKIRP